MALSYYLSKPCDIILRVFNIGGEAIKTFSSSGTLGYNSFSWDGVLDTGEIAGNGVYLYQISARDATGGVTTAKGKIIILR
jgi:flagellar hook assembly protein FlgD